VQELLAFLATQCGPGRERFFRRFRSGIDIGGLAVRDVRQRPQVHRRNGLKGGGVHGRDRLAADLILHALFTEAGEVFVGLGDITLKR